jgi:Flp pilus assembly pilin Flp
MNNLKAKLLDETGAATAEYAIATMAAVGFAGLLVVIMRSDEVRTILFDLVKSALTFSSPNAEVAPQ